MKRGNRMDLIRIMLVDDEEEVRKSIGKKIAWEELGFFLAGDAENGEEAFELMDTVEPDVVMTDIRMPYMDGLTLAEKLKRQYPSVKVVIFSGYDEFEYAKQAIHLNVIEYILKPVNVEELTASLLKIKEKMLEEMEEKRDMATLRERFTMSLPLVREHFLYDLVHGRLHEKPDENRILELLSYYDIPLKDAEGWCALLIAIDGPEMEEEKPALPFHREQELMYISVKQLVEEALSGNFCFSAFRTSDCMGVIAAMDHKNGMRKLLVLLESICRDCRKILKLKVSIGVGGLKKECKEIKNSYEESKDALGYRLIMGTGKVIYINDVEPVQKIGPDFDSKLETALLTSVKFGSVSEITDNIKQIVTYFESRKLHSSQHQIQVIYIMNLMMHLMQKYELGQECIFGKNNDFIELLSQLSNGEKLGQWLLKVCLRIHENIHEERVYTAKKLVEKAKKYIEENYSNKELSVDMVCQELHISSAYFSTIFKKETGQSYVAYVTDLRLNRATELLNETEDKSYVIAARVGYAEPNYFSYVFKKKYGVAPSKYREN